MPEVGDRVRVASTKGAPRDGVVTAVIGELLHVEWSTGEESTIAPAPGSIAVTGKAKVARASKSVKATPTKKAAAPLKVAETKKVPAPVKAAKAKKSGKKAR